MKYSSVKDGGEISLYTDWVDYILPLAITVFMSALLIILALKKKR